MGPKMKIQKVLQTRLALLLLVLYSTFAVVQGFSPSFAKARKYPNVRVPCRPRPSIHQDSAVRKSAPLYQESGLGDGKEQEQNAFTNFQSSVSRMWSDFRFGAMHVNENFFSLSRRVAVKMVQVLVPLHLFFVLGAIYYPSFQELARAVLVKVLLAVSYVSNAVLVLLASPFVALRIGATMIMKRKFEPAIFFKLLKPGAEYQDEKVDVSSVLFAVFFHPILEETTYRLFFDHIWRRVARLVGRNKKSQVDLQDTDETSESSTPTLTTRKWLGFEPWVLVSSLLFATAHLSNWLPPPDKSTIDTKIASIDWEKFQRPHLAELKKMDDPEKYRRIITTWPQAWMRFILTFQPIFGSAVQVVVAGFCSLYVYSPIYQQRGIMASIGAHFAWNLAVFTWWRQAVMRLQWRFILWLRLKFSKKSNQE